MKNGHFIKVLLSAAWLMILTLHQATGQSKVLTFSTIMPANDSIRMAGLHQNGIKIQAGDVIAWFPKDSLTNERMRAITDTMNLGIRLVKKYIKSPLPWQRLKEGQHITFYFSPDNFISHANQKGATFVPFWRIKSGRAPWLHEAIHDVFAPEKMQPDHAEAGEERPLWLSEGSAEYVSLQVSADHNIPKLDLFNAGSIKQVDKSCMDLLKSDNSAYILSNIGSPGAMPELGGKERRAYATVFYNCSCSLVKYLVSQYGIASLMDVIGAFPHEQQKLKAVTGLLPSALREKWLNEINAWNGVSAAKYMRQDSLDNLLNRANQYASKIPASKWFVQTMQEKGIDEAIKNFKSAWNNKDNRYRYSEDQLNQIGYNLLDKKKTKDAIAVLGLNAEMYPESSNAYDSWAEAFLNDGQTKLAVTYYNRSLELDPDNINAKTMLTRIKQP